jgi:hypothetical protein
VNQEEQKRVSIALRIVSLLCSAQEERTPETKEERRIATERLDALMLAEDYLREALSIPTMAVREEILHVNDPWAGGLTFGVRGQESRVRRILKAARAGKITGEKWKK